MQPVNMPTDNSKASGALKKKENSIFRSDLFDTDSDSDSKSESESDSDSETDSSESEESFILPKISDLIDNRDPEPKSDPVTAKINKKEIETQTESPDDTKDEKRVKSTRDLILDCLIIAAIVGQIGFVIFIILVSEARVPEPHKNCMEIQRTISWGYYVYQNFPNENNIGHEGQNQGQGQGSKSSSWQVISPLKHLQKGVLCDFETNGGGWTVIQQRMPGAPHALFYRNWRDYEQGFGVNDSYWLGLEVIRALTSYRRTPVTLRIELTDWAGETRWAEYKNFKVESADDSYRLRVSGYSGDAGDSLTYHNNQKFSTLDRDNDALDDEHCALSRHSGWWFYKCAETNINGLFWEDPYDTRIYESIPKGNGVTWSVWKGHHYSLKKVQMKIRPADFVPG